MIPFEWYNLNVYHVMGSWQKMSFSKNAQNTVLELWGITRSNLKH